MSYLCCSVITCACVFLKYSEDPFKGREKLVNAVTESGNVKGKRGQTKKQKISASGSRQKTVSISNGK